MKRRVRTLLKSARMSTDMWAHALRHVSELLWREVHGGRGKVPAFGSPVMVKVKEYNRTSREVFAPIAVRGRFAGLLPDLSVGGLVMLEDGRTFRASTMGQLPDPGDEEEKALEIGGWKKRKDPEDRDFWEHESGARQRGRPTMMEEQVEDQGNQEELVRRRLTRKTNPKNVTGRLEQQLTNEKEGNLEEEKVRRELRKLTQKLAMLQLNKAKVQEEWFLTEEQEEQSEEGEVPTVTRTV